MDPNLISFSDDMNGFRLEDDRMLPLPNSSDQFLNLANDLRFNIPSHYLNFLDVPFVSPQSVTSPFAPTSLSVNPEGDLSSLSTGWSLEGESSSPTNDTESSDPVLKYISQMLLEENMEDKPHTFPDPYALEDTEKSLYEALNQEGSAPVDQSLLPPYMDIESPDSTSSGGSSDHASSTFSTTSSSTRSGSTYFVDHSCVGEDKADQSPSLSQDPLPGDHKSLPNMQNPTFQVDANPTIDLNSVGSGLMESSVHDLLLQSIFRDQESILQFKKGFEEASKFIPSCNQLLVNVGSNTFSAPQKEEATDFKKKVHEKEKDRSLDGSTGKKNHKREDADTDEERSNKQSAVSTEDQCELAEVFDRVLLCVNNEVLKKELNMSLEQNGQMDDSNGGKARGKKHNKRKETVDLRTLLILCAQAVSVDDRRTAGELLKQIREHSSPHGDGSQRLAHYFANALEARLNGSGTGARIFISSPRSQKISAADILKGYKAYLCASPFKKLAIFYANKTIYKMAEKAKALHIVDFGILYGFQWPILIQHLSMRPGGPPKLRITGIDIPQTGFRPAERIEETGRRLARYCKRFKVPFEYNPIAAKNWETIRIEDLKLDRSEMLAVNCLYRFKHLLDETTEADCPRDTVLKLIRKMNPDIFVHGICNGSYNAPFFVTRFREALFFYSALFDMFDASLPREEPARMMYEREIYGREAMNVVACEGPGRIERPENYKQWQVRMVRAGFKPLPLDQEMVQALKSKQKAWYHKDFVTGEDKNWVLQGWKGRIIVASSCWVPSSES